MLERIATKQRNSSDLHGLKMVVEGNFVSSSRIGTLCRTCCRMQVLNKTNEQKKSSFLMKFSVLNVLPYSIFFWYYEWFAKLCCPLLVYGWHDMSSAVYSWKSSFLFLWSVVSNYILHFMLKCIIIYLLFASNALLKSCVVAFLLFLLNLFSVEVPCLNLFLGCKVVDDI